MSSRHQPVAGADSEYVLHAFDVVMRDPDGFRIKVTIPAALGPNDARHQAEDLRPGWEARRVEQVPAS